MSTAESITFAPQQVSAQAVQTIQDRQDNPRVGVETGIKSVDKWLNPHRPGELRVILGYTSNYKSGLMNYIARAAAKRILEREEADKKCVITVTWEQSVEEQGITDLAQLSVIDVTKMMRGELTTDDWGKLRRAAVKRGTLPWWLIGHSSQNAERRPRLTMSELGKALAYIVDQQGVKPELICLDYLQRIKREGEGEARLQFMEIVDRSKDMALAFGVPVLLGSQAKRECQARAWKLPTLEDAQETSNLEQSADSFVSLMMPKQSYPDGMRIEYGNFTVTTGPNVLVLGILKQKFGIAPKLIELHVKPEINEIYDTEKVKL